MTVSLKYTDTGGQGEPLIIVHGLLGSADNWRSHVKQWSSERRVIAVDLRNHGRSPHAEGMEYSQMAEDVAAVMEQCGVVRGHLLGHSMGGKVVMTLARLRPDLVASLIVADIAPVAYEHRHDGVFSALRRVERGQPTDRREADALMAEVIDDKSTRMFLATNLVRGDDRVLRLRVNLDAIEAGYGQIMAAPGGEGNIEVPTLVLRGSRSDYVADDLLAPLRTVLPSAEIKTLDAGHWLHTERAQEFQQQVTEFLDSLAA